MLPTRAHAIVLCGLVLTLGGCRPGQSRPMVPQMVGEIQPLDPSFTALVPAGARLEQLASGFAWSEGPVWRKSGGYLLFTDIPKNTIHRWHPSEGLSVFLRPAGFAMGAEPPSRELGSNGLALDASDRLVMADHGNRLIARLDESVYIKTTLADRFEGKRLNSPNDVVVRSNGDIYFTDPPYGLKSQRDDDPAKELPFNGVYRLTSGGELTALTRELTRPNGLAFSPDERTLYVANSDPARAIWMAYDVQPDGTLARGRVFFDATPLVRQGRQGLPDGLKVDERGNLFATGPGGVLVLSPDGRHLGTIATGQPTANCAFGDADGSTLYITANDRLLRIRLGTRGARF
jgi:gluconolactonase